MNRLLLLIFIIICTCCRQVPERFDYRINQNVSLLDGNTFVLETVAYNPDNTILCLLFVYEDTSLRKVQSYRTTSHIWTVKEINDSVKIAQYKYAKGILNKYKEKIRPIDTSKL